MILILGCSFNYTPNPLFDEYLNRAQTKSRNGITVTVTVLSAEESKKVFGVELYDDGVQPVWIKIKNDRQSPIVFLPITLDPEYYSPHEVSFLNHRKFQGETNNKMDEDFNNLAIDLEIIEPNKEVAGFVFTNVDPGLKFLNVVLTGNQKTERFPFLLEVPGIEPDYQKVDIESIYSFDEIIEFMDYEKLFQALKNLPCCSTRLDGSGNGDPLNFIIISDLEPLLGAFIKRRWDVSRAIPHNGAIITEGGNNSLSLLETSPMGILYMFGRRQDISFQKSRLKEGYRYRQRNQIRIWLTPFRFNEKPIWICSVSRDIGSDLKRKQYNYLAESIDPEIDESRDYLLEDIILSLHVSKYGWLSGVGETTPENPHMNFLNQPWWTDGYRPVIVIEDIQIPLSELQQFPWHDIEKKLYEEYKDKRKMQESPLKNPNSES